jgi:hypothetical protein
MPLKKLDLQTWQGELGVLAGMPLEELHLAGTKSVRDISFVRGMPLRVLFLRGLPELKDISPLRGLPLIELQIRECGNIDDLDTIRSLKSLERLVLPAHMDLNAIRAALPKLKQAGQ